MLLNTLLALCGATLLLLGGPTPASHADTLASSGHGQSAAERSLETPPGPWQGNWRVTRDDPRLRTRAGAELARLHIMQDQGSGELSLQWVAGRAMCEDPSGGPCEWSGAAGESTRATATDQGGLRAQLAVSADIDDPFTLSFPRRPQGTEVVEGWLSSARPGIRWRVSIERDAP